MWKSRRFDSHLPPALAFGTFRSMPPKIRMKRSLFLGALAAITQIAPTLAGDLRVTADFPGGSARVESVDQSTRTIHFMPGGDPAHGWACWWSLRVDGADAGEKLILDLAGSDLPTRNNGRLTDKPLAASWAMPGRASFSTDAGKTWKHTPPGRRAGVRMEYEVVAENGGVLVAWGPPFTSANAEELIATVEKVAPSAAKRFELCRTRAGRIVPALRISEAVASDIKPYGIWIDARQHAWETGSSWVARGLVEWLVSDDEAAVWLRQHSETIVVPILDVDNVETGNGGKEADPRDHNRDWSDTPFYPEVAAAQARLRQFAAEERLDLFVNLHNPAPGDSQPFFFCGPLELLPPLAQRNRATFLAQARVQINGPLVLQPEPRTTGPNYHPLWRQISGQWVSDHGNVQTVSACLETSWNTPHSTVDGYRTVGRQLGQAIAAYFRTNPRSPSAP
jgi:hypothetical protein